MKKEPALRILIVEDNPGDYFLVGEYLKEGPWALSVSHARNLAEAMVLADTQEFDIILLDLTLPDSTGMDSVQAILPLQPTIPVIVLTGMEDEQFGVDSLSMGAQDYLVKDQINGPLLVKSIRYSIERCRVQQSMLKQDRLFRLITDNSPAGKLLIKPDGQIHFCTHSVKAVLGYDAPDVLGQNALDFVYPDDRPVLIEALQKNLQNPEKQLNVELRVRHADGHYVWCENGISNLMNENLVDSLVITFWDVTESKNAEYRLKVSEERYRNLFEVSPASIIVWDIESGRILQVNETAEREYGYNRDQFRELCIGSIMADKNDPDCFNKLVQQLKAGNRANHKGISRRIRRDGQVIMMEYHAHLVSFNGTQAMFLLEQNVTEKLELEATLEAERLARHQMVTDAVLSAQEHERREIGIELHDNINQVLASARLYLGLVQLSVPEQASFIEETDKLIARAINEIRNLSHSLIPPSLNESALLEALDDIIAITRRTKGISITRSYHDIDESQMSDKLKLTIYRIVQEQFNNIIKYAQAKSVNILLRRDEGRIILSIKDDGVGFNPQEKTGGVGLMNMKTRASLFKGDIQVISAPGQGCEVLAMMDAE